MIHDLLRRLVGRAFPSAARTDAQGVMRLVLPRPNWDSYVRLAVDEIREYGKGSLQVDRRQRYLLEDLLTVAPPWRRAELRRQLALLDARVERDFEDAPERARAMRASPQGQGPS